VVGCCEYGDEPSGSCAMKLVSLVVTDINTVIYICSHNLKIKYFKVTLWRVR
jgi:hypothetical protein